MYLEGGQAVDAINRSSHGTYQQGLGASQELLGSQSQETTYSERGREAIGGVCWGRRFYQVRTSNLTQITSLIRASSPLSFCIFPELLSQGVATTCESENS